MLRLEKPDHNPDIFRNPSINAAKYIMNRKKKMLLFPPIYSLSRSMENADKKSGIAIIESKSNLDEDEITFSSMFCS